MTAEVHSWSDLRTSLYPVVLLCNSFQKPGLASGEDKLQILY